MREYLQTSEVRNFKNQASLEQTHDEHPGLTLAQVEAIEAADRLRATYRLLGIDEETIQVLYDRQTHGTETTPSNVVFMIAAAEAAEEVGEALSVITRTREERTPLREKYYQAFVAREANRPQKKEPIV